MNPLYLFACWVILHVFLSSVDIFQNQLFRKILSGYQVLNSLNPDQAQQRRQSKYSPNFQINKYVNKYELYYTLVEIMQELYKFDHFDLPLPYGAVGWSAVCDCGIF